MALLEGPRSRLISIACGAWLRHRGAQVGSSVRLYGWPIVTGDRLENLLLGDRVVLISDAGSTALGVRTPTILRLLRPGALLAVGDDCGLSGVTVCAAQSIRIGARCLLGADVMIFDTDFHPRSADGRRYAVPDWERISDAVNIGDDVFIGTRATICKGVTIGDGAIVGAGSVVTRSIPAGEVWAGSPARRVGLVESAT